jgi:hypothetical protein
MKKRLKAKRLKPISFCPLAPEQAISAILRVRAQAKGCFVNGTILKSIFIHPITNLF